MIDKERELAQYSNFAAVRRQAKRYGLDPSHIRISTRKTHKYVYLVPGGKAIHFGAWGMEDFTKHKDEERRKRFQIRNKRWETAPKASAAWLSYHLLW